MSSSSKDNKDLGGIPPGFIHDDESSTRCEFDHVTVGAIAAMVSSLADDTDLEVGKLKMEEEDTAETIQLVVLKEQGGSPRDPVDTDNTTTISVPSQVLTELNAAPAAELPTQIPDLNRQTGVAQVFPGAIAVEGPGSWSRRGGNNNNDSLADENTIESQDIASRENSREGDIIAHLVHEDDGLLQNAVPDMRFHRIRKYWRRKLYFALSIQTIVGMAAVAIILAVFLAIRTRNSSEWIRQHQNGWMKSPSAAGDVETPAPTSLLHVLALPDSTQRAMLDRESPQARAYEWLMSDTSIHVLPEWKLRQLFVLVTFYYSTKGDYWVKKHCWLDWKTNDCHWEQVPTAFKAIDSPDLHCSDRELITSLDFSTNNLEGTIPPEISLLSTGLQHFALRQNLGVSGVLPTELGLLTKLTSLMLFATSLSGSLPTELGRLESLIELTIGSNKMITGPLPTEIGNLCHLTKLELTSTDFSGSFPSEIYQLPNLKQLTIRDCPGLITEPLLQNICDNMPQLELLSLSCEQCSVKAPITSAIDKLTNLSLFSLSINSLIGTIPSELGKLTKITALGMHSSSISGTVPTVLAKVSHLKYINFRSNHLVGTLSPGLFSHLTELRGVSIDDKPFGRHTTNWSLFPAQTLAELAKQLQSVLGFNTD
ncbi:STYKc [Seminavis robusta]|uniref:STYKc n=1 Tax=Seminavis robusta TaxID=568900 RepID=A0A9N8HTU9_9STRA|nr:STYKc [Seminavis robusta]|eukprot:Sro1945_g306980.1 STYKc (653) ;mRNA; r:12131-14410